MSAFCGAVTAAAGAGAATTYLAWGTDEQIINTAIMILATANGITCDGAKSSCAAKIAGALDVAFTSHNMSMNGCSFCPGEGLVASSAEETIRIA